MTRARGRRAALVLPPSLTAVAALALTGCGTRTVDSTGAEAPSGRPTAAVTSASPADALCPGETPKPTPTAPAVTENPENGHYAENHGFMMPLPLHGQRRCDGLTEVRRVTAALEPLRKKGDLSAGRVRAGLVALGYAPESVSVSAYGSTYVGFVVDHTPVCLKGALNTAVTEVDAFAGYADGTGCRQPRGGH
ncbi:hypothetical protein [Streptomyces sp. NPDC008139]|uniref:hypothetical protein n=1 Tax=Streptomyces sp. NPDC008139 TaxID=3364814 RepID=UPI0036ED5FD7